ncbi:MAG: hypothetical protein H7A23_17940 [Leptospiraceae bacterium]|nr:hypothetical protein [Leptospiraceae bacterium]MCP5496432.1 hypothetical protein [Leptospiraceae bacterium]
MKYLEKLKIFLIEKLSTNHYDNKASYDILEKDAGNAKFGIVQFPSDVIAKINRIKNYGNSLFIERNPVKKISIQKNTKKLKNKFL